MVLDLEIFRIIRKDPLKMLNKALMGIMQWIFWLSKNLVSTEIMERLVGTILISYSHYNQSHMIPCLLESL